MGSGGLKKFNLQYVEHQCVCRVDEQDDQPDGVGDAVGFRERIAEPASSPDVLLQQVTRDGEADHHPNPIPLYGAREQARGHHYQENQSAGHLQPIWEVPGKEKAQDDGDESDPLADLSPEYGEQPRREGQKDVGDQQGREHVRPPVRPIQDQQVAAIMHKIKVKERTLFSAHNMVMFEITSCFAETCLMESHVRAGHSRAGPSREARSGSPRPIK